MRLARFLVVAATLLVLQSCCRCCFNPNCDDENSSGSRPVSGRIGTVYRDDPQVAAGPSGSLVTVQTQRDLNNHDEVRVSAGGRARLEFYRGASEVVSLVLYSDTQLERVRADEVNVDTDEPLWIRMRLAFGLATINVKQGGSQHVALPNGVDVMIRGTQAYVLYDRETGYASIGNFGGETTWSYKGGDDVAIASGDLVDIDPDGNYTIHPLPFTLEELDASVRRCDNPIWCLMDARRKQGGDVPPAYDGIETPVEPPPAGKETVRVLVLVPLSGPLAEFGTGVLNGAQMSWQDFSGSLGHQVELLVHDDQSDAKVALSRLQDILPDESVVCSVGPFTSLAARLTADVYHQADLPFVSPAATSSDITEKGYAVVNRVIGRDEVQGAAAVRFAAEQGISSILLEVEGDGYSQAIASRLRQEAEQRGVQIITLQEFYVSAPAGIWPGLAYYAGRPENAGQFFRSLRNAGYYGPLMGSDAINSPQMLEAGSTILLEGGGLYYTTPVMPARFYPGAAVFTERYAATYGVWPPMFAAQGYDAMTVCLEAIRFAEANGMSRGSVAKGIRSNSVSGVTGLVQFNQNGDLLDAPYFVVRVLASSADDWYQAQEATRIFNILP